MTDALFRLMVAFALHILLCWHAFAGLNITTNAQAYLDDPDRDILVVLGVTTGKEQNVISALKIAKSETIPEFGIIFAKVKAHDVLEWPDDTTVNFVDVIDNSQDAVVYHLIAQLHRIALLENVGTFRRGRTQHKHWTAT